MSNTLMDAQSEARACLASGQPVPEKVLRVLLGASEKASRVDELEKEVDAAWEYLDNLDPAPGSMPRRSDRTTLVDALAALGGAYHALGSMLEEARQTAFMWKEANARQLASRREAEAERDAARANVLAEVRTILEPLHKLVTEGGAWPAAVWKDAIARAVASVFTMPLKLTPQQFGTAPSPDAARSFSEQQVRAALYFAGGDWSTVSSNRRQRARQEMERAVLLGAASYLGLRLVDAQGRRFE